MIALRAVNSWEVIRLIMWMTQGPTDPSAVVEFTDWDQVVAFGLVISSMEISDS